MDKVTIENSFNLWMNTHPTTTHPSDRDRLFDFVKNICLSEERNWKDIEFISERIQEKKEAISGYSEEWFTKTIIIIEYLLDFYKVIK